MSKHTPEPWKLGKEEKQTRHSCGHDNCKEHPLRVTGCELRAGKNSLWIADIHGEHLRVPVDEFRANAHLMVAAPELLEACKFGYILTRNFRVKNKNTPLWNDSDERDFQKMKQAIAKAEGGER